MRELPVEAKTTIPCGGDRLQTQVVAVGFSSRPAGGGPRGAPSLPLPRGSWTRSDILPDGRDRGRAGPRAVGDSRSAHGDHHALHHGGRSVEPRGQRPRRGPPDRGRAATIDRAPRPPRGAKIPDVRSTEGARSPQQDSVTGMAIRADARRGPPQDGAPKAVRRPTALDSCVRSVVQRGSPVALTAGDGSARARARSTPRCARPSRRRR